MITIQKKLLTALALIALLAAWILTTPSNADDAEVIEAETLEDVTLAKTIEKTPAKPKVESTKDKTKTSTSEAKLADKAAKVLELQIKPLKYLNYRDQKYQLNVSQRMFII